MKKLLAGLFIFGFFAIGVQVTHASILSDALSKIDSLQKELMQLKANLGASALASDPGEDPILCPIGSTSCTPTSDTTPRISYWGGKVNQHVDVSSGNGMWLTDPDGSSGSGVDQLSYCKKWYPNTTRVEEYKNETISTWHSAGNVGSYPSTKMSYKCVQENTDIRAFVMLNSPKGGETYQSGQKVTVVWNTDGFLPTDTVHLSINDSNNKYPFALSTTNDGQETITIPTVSSTSNYTFIIKVDGDKYAASDDSEITIKQLATSATPAITLKSNPQSDSSGNVVIKLGDSITFNGIPSNLTGNIGVDYNRSFNFDPIFDNVCLNTTSEIWTQTCTPTKTGAGSFYIKIIKNGQVYNSNLIIVTVLNNMALPSTPTTDTTNRISMWQGKVNQHVVAGDVYTWQTDSDGVSGAELDKLTYCKKFYPNTTSVESYKNETINTWKERLNVGNYASTKMSYKCVQGDITNTSSVTVNSPNGGETFVQGQFSNRISWSGGKNKVQIGLFKKTNSTYSGYSGGAGIIGWIELNGKPNSSLIWDGITLKSLDGSIISAPAPYSDYSIIAVTESNEGNYCLKSNDSSPCSSDISNSTFTITPLLEPGEDPTGCPIGAIYSSTTGQLCSSSSAVETGCSNGNIYSSTTGQKCLNNSTTPSNINSNNTYANNIVASSQSNQTLKVGVKSDDVKILQRFLGITEDGSFGPMTKAKVMEWQAANGLTPDGAFGKNSRQKAGF